jgi:hypothetical protein
MIVQATRLKTPSPLDDHLVDRVAAFKDLEDVAGGDQREKDVRRGHGRSGQRVGGFVGCVQRKLPRFFVRVDRDFTRRARMCLPLRAADFSCAFPDA